MYAAVMSVTVTLTIIFELVAACMVATSFEGLAWAALGASIFALACTSVVFHLCANKFLASALLTQGSPFLLILATVLYSGMQSDTGIALTLTIGVFAFLIWPTIPLASIAKNGSNESWGLLYFAGFVPTAPFLALGVVAVAFVVGTRWVLSAVTHVGILIFCLVGGDDSDD